MDIELKEITVRELADGYKDKGEDGVTGLSGKLDIRPPYQREFIYKDPQRDAVITTVKKGFPLNVMYWAVRDNKTIEDNGIKYEIIDGQQRTISLCQYVNNDFSYEGRSWVNLQDDEKEQIQNYKLTIYLCSGRDSERLDWFRTINIAGEKLTDQELRNAVYSGSWVSDAKRYFSKRNRPRPGDKYLTGSANRQEYLETAIDWISKGKIDDYMSKNQREPNANKLWLYFQKVINWVDATFPNYRREMKGVKWGILYNEFKKKNLDPIKLEEEITELMLDDDVTKKSGIYSYILTRADKYLNLRSFTDSQKREAYERKKGICTKCKEHFEIEEMDADHIKPWREGGKTISDNCQMLCKPCNRALGGK